MENQVNEVAATPRQIIHLQVAGVQSQEDLVNILTQFQETLNNGGIIATQDNVVANVINTTSDLSGMILTPKMTAVELAAVAVDVLNGFEEAQNNAILPRFDELDQEAKIEILKRIQFILRFGSFQTIADDASSGTRDALFEAVVRSLGSKLTQPSTENLITVTRIAQKEGDEDFEVSFLELVQGDIFKHGEGIFVAESNPYVNWIASPLPIITIDAKLYQAPEQPAPEDVKRSKPSKKKVQSKPSNSTAKTRKK